MASFNLSGIGEQLKQASEPGTGTSGVSLAGKSLKLNTEEDAEVVVEAIKKCAHLEYLDLEGNTLGPEAAKAIAQILETKGASLKRALWKDMFTGRMKSEIPLALEYLGNGLRTASTQLVELDLSDNAFGPIGVQGLAAFLSSKTCFTLRALRLNNNGLGITGGKMLAKALLDCHANSSKDGGQALALRIFVAGRNRLENEGAEALAEVFQELGTLEEVVMPQNGIYHVGVAALAKALAANPQLRVLNLNDNTVGPKGAQALAQTLPHLPLLERLNLGDCLLKTKGAIVLAGALKGSSHPCLTELNLSFNEIRARGIGSIAEAVIEKDCLSSLQLDGNAFGPDGRKELREALTQSDRIYSLGTLDEDESDNESEDDNDSVSEHDEDEKEVEEEENEEGKDELKKKEVTVEDFLKTPTAENLLLLKGDKGQSLINHAKSIPGSGDEPLGDRYAEELSRTIMKVSALCGSGYMDAREEAERITEILYAELFAYATKNNQVSRLNNALLVNLGLIKSEDKNAGAIDWNLEGCYKALEKISQRDYFLTQTKDTLKVFIERPARASRTRVDPFQEAKASLKTALERVRTT